jgi:hypothetical protein
MLSLTFLVVLPLMLNGRYVATSFSADGSDVMVSVRGKMLPAKVINYLDDGVVCINILVLNSSNLLEISQCVNWVCNYVEVYTFLFFLNHHK